VLSPGSKFGAYLVGSCIGEGGMARIYQAEHAGLRRQVALKVLIDGFAKDPDGRERFVREARIAAAIKHPNVVNIFDVGVHQDIPYLVMEFLEGQDLERMLETKGFLDEGLIVDIMVPVVAGLSAVHDAGIVHRDLKPGNIYLAKGRYNDLEPKLLDFGISKAPGPDQLKLTANGTLMGTPFYISPEGLHGGEMTPLSDQYSLGVVMYECATGFTPFRASTFAELFKLITAGQYTPPTVHKPELSKRLARIIERAMSREPERRFKDLREMGRELLLLAGQRTRITWGLSFGNVKDTLASSSNSHASGGNSGPSPEQLRRRKQLALVVLFAIAPLLVLGGGLYALVSGRFAGEKTARPPPPPSSASAAAAPVEAPRATAAAEVAPDPSYRLMATATAESAGRPEPARPPTMTPAPSERSNLARRESSSVRAAPEQAATRRATRTTTPTNRSPAPASDPEPEWALPAGSSSPNPTKSGEAPLGANGAPIFD
jgi:eukaryotic-like serine/threonine-protein kinase